MCGIAGYISEKIPDDFIARSSSLLLHRGPDACGSFSDKNVSLIHTRLSILDLKSGDQPMYSSDGNFVVVYNGEIYNHKELRKELSKKYVFRSQSDTETLLLGYIEYGEKILNRLNGIFSFAIYNKSTQELFIARDPLGVKPLYYCQNENGFIFSSEIKSLKSFSLDKSISYSSLLNYLTLLYSPGETSPLKDVKKLLPGYFIKVNVKQSSEIVIKKYCDLPYPQGVYSHKSEKDLEKLLEEKLFQTIERQMLSDVPLGFFLSGGLDSSSLVALAKAIYPDKKLQCFTANLGETKKTDGFYNDLHYARKAAKHLNVQLEEINVTSEILQHFDRMIYHLDEPIADPAALYTHAIAKQAKEMGFKVLISGTGGDEVFSGYRRHQAMQMEMIYPYLPNFLIHALQKSLSVFRADQSIRRRGEKLLRYSNVDKSTRMISYLFKLEVNTAKGLFSTTLDDIIESYKPELYFHHLLNQLPKGLNDLNQLLYLDMKSYLPDNNLIYTDKMSMSTGVETRVPFLDKELIEFASQLPPELKMKGTTTKYLLRKVMRKYLPEEIIERPKTGFGAPVRKWITNDLVEKINTELSYTRINKRGIFDADKVWGLINDNKSGKIDASYSIWALLAIESWMRQFVDE